MKREEAIKKLRQMSLPKETMEILEAIAPELRESEDERIRKELINFLRSPFIKENLTDEKVAPWLEWLEKQKEQKPCEPKNWPANKDTLTQEQKPELVQQPPITYTYNSNASRDERLKAALLALLNSDLLKVKEGGYFTKQDLIEWVERIPTVKPAENDCRFIDEKFMETDFWKQYVKDSIIPGSKPTQQDIDFLLPQAKNLFALATKDMCNGCKDWSRGYNAGLANAEKAEREKSVIVTKQEYDSHSIVTRDAVSVKPAEWSEEDKRAINDAIVSLSEIANGEIPHLLPSILLEVVERLKSLCPQPHWKPSEEDKEMKLKILKYLSTRCSLEQFEEVEEWLNNKLK